jgi:NAD(P)H dehydrogenase (quinone)
MSDTLVVHFHPLTNSFSAAMRNRAVAGLTTRDGTAPAVIDIGERPLAVDIRLRPTSLVLVYPTWWSGQPAALSQWLSDALPQLSAVTRLVAVSSHGSPKRINLLEGENGKRLLRKVVLPRCAPGASFSWIAFYNIDAAPDAKRLAFLERVERRLAK